jgi:hypothetical protein
MLFYAQRISLRSINLFHILLDDQEIYDDVAGMSRVSTYYIV